MKKIFIACLLALTVSCANAQDKKGSPSNIEYTYKCIRGNDMAIVTKLLETYFALGWEPVMSEAQSVSTSINKYQSPYYRDLKGEVIFILRKKK